MSCFTYTNVFPKMKIFKSTFIAFTIFLPFLASSQEVNQAPKLPMDEKGEKINYTGVVEVKGNTTGTLYERALLWANTFYKNPTDVIREKDSTAGKIVCKARFKVMNPADKKGLATDAGNVMYTLTLQFKEGRYRYELTDFNWKQQSYYACERWMDKTKASYEPKFDYYLQQVNSTAGEVLKSLEKSISTAPSAKTDDW